MKSHNIHVVKTYVSGAEEWHCPTCNRRFIVQWSPEYQFIVLEAGNANAIHNMGRGAMVLAVRSSEEPAEFLQPWLDWLNQIDLENRLGEKDQ